MTRWTMSCVLVLLATGCSAPMHQESEEVFNFWPLARYERGVQPEGHTVDVLWPFIHDHRSGDATRSWVFPFHAATDDGKGHTFRNIGGLHWSERDAAERWSTWNIFPFFWSKESPKEDMWHLWPLWGRKLVDGDPATRTDWYMWPLGRWTRSDNGVRNEAAVLDLDPLFTVLTSHREPGGGGRTHARTRAVSLLGGLLSLYSARDEPLGDDLQHEAWRALSFFDVVSLAGSERDVDADGEVAASASHLFPVYANRRAADGASRGWLVPPLYGWEDDPAAGLSAFDVLWPLGRYETHEGDDPRWHLRALPLLWFTKRPESTTQVAFPFYYRVTDAKDDYLHVVPFYGRHVLDGGVKRRSFVVPPLWIHSADDRDNTSRHDVLFPLAATSRSDDESMSRVFPIFYQRDTTLGDESHTNVLLGFDRQRDPQGGSTILWPLLGRAHASTLGSENGIAEVGHEWSVLPLLDARFLTGFRPKGEATSVLFPLSRFARDGDEVSRWVLPFYWWFDDGQGTSHKHIWPFYGRDTKPDGFTRTWTAAHLFFWGGTPDDSERDLGLFFPFGYWERTPAKTRHWALPLWYHRAAHDRAESTTWVLWPLFSRSVEPDGHRLTHSLGWLYRNEVAPSESEAGAIGETEETWVLGGLYHGRRDAKTTRSSVAFLYSYENDGVDRTLKLFHLIPISL